MFHKLFCVFFIVGLVSAAVTEKTIENKSIDLPPGFGTPHDYTAYVEDETNHDYALSSVLDSTNLLSHVFYTIAAYKSAALGFAVNAIAWVIRNIVVIAIGAIGAIGFCKFTDKCSLAHKYYDEIAHFRSYVTPERLASAEKFLITAVEKYASEIKKAKLKKLHGKQ